MTDQYSYHLFKPTGLAEPTLPLKALILLYVQSCETGLNKV